MPEIKTTNVSVNWTSTQAFAVALISLLLGLAGGWFIRKSFVPAPAATAVASPAAPADNPPVAPLGSLAAMPTPDQLKKMADTQAAPLLDNLKSDPSNPDLLARIGNIYYDVKHYPEAIDYYERSLKLEPNKANTLFNIGIVKWQSKNDAAGAIAVWQKLLDTNPNYEARDKVQQMIDQAKSGSHAPISE